jgi:hypothetical protein
MRILKLLKEGVLIVLKFTAYLQKLHFFATIHPMLRH